MFNWILLLILAQIIWSVCSIIDKFLLSKDHIKNPAVFIVFNGLMNILLIFIVPFIGIKPIGFTDILVAVSGGMCLNAAILIYYRAIKEEEASRVIIIAQSTPLFVLFWAFLFLGETLSLNNAIGFILLLSAGLIVSFRKVHGFLRPSKVFYLMLLSMIVGSLGAIPARHIYAVTDFWSAFFWLRIGQFTSLAVLLSPPVRKGFIETLKTMDIGVKGILSFKIIIDFCAFIAMGYVILKTPALAISSALASAIQPIMVFVLTLVASLTFPKVIKEDIDVKSLSAKLFALLLVVAGMVFVTM